MAGIATFIVRAFHFILYITALIYKIKFDFKNFYTWNSFFLLRGLGLISINSFNSTIASIKGAIETNLNTAFLKNCTLKIQKYTFNFSNCVESKALLFNIISLLLKILKTAVKE